MGKIYLPNNGIIIGSITCIYSCNALILTRLNA